MSEDPRGVDDLEGDRLLTPVELGRLWGRTVEALAEWRCRHEGPPFVRLGRRGLIRYRLSAVRQYVEEHEEPVPRS